ncbi:MAG: ABC transporter ATP-binding protein [Ancalomicrobiaceae bacterium]|nr:ABC transporter ATP-binding protein [Ancalomicrobiaceae bacterium]
MERSQGELTVNVGRADTDGPRAVVLLEALGLAKSYGPVAAVQGVDFRLPVNAYVTLLGPSGCGKTSILRMIGGFETPSAGSLRLDGADLAGVGPAERPVNTVFQSYALFPHMTVADNVAFGLEVKGRDRNETKIRTARALALVRMTDMADRRPNQLSGGQQQRVALARAIVNEPRLLLLDEPLSALDRRMRKDMQIELKDLQRRLGLTFVHVTHDQEEAFALSDHLIVMNAGRIEQQGTPEEIYRRPATTFVADFIGGANLFPGQILATSDGAATIATAFGPVTAASVSGLSVGSTAALCLRPELLTPQPDGPILSTVRHVVFQGADWLVEVEAAERTVTLRLESERGPEPGERLAIGFDAASAWITAGTIATEAGHGVRG